MDLFGASALGDRLVALVDAPGFVPAAFGLAFVAGAAHAVGPGHGKSLAAAYLVGSEGKVRDAAWLGLSVAVMHTVSVLVIAVAWTFFSLSDLVRLGHLTTGLQLVGGVLVIGVGIWLFRRHLRAGGHGHGHSHGHGHGSRDGRKRPPRPPEDGRKRPPRPPEDGRERPPRPPGAPSRPGLVLLGMSGGLTPSPAAFLVLITGLFSGRSGFALLLVMTFGLGLASVLFAVGLLALTGRNVVVRAAESRKMFAVATRVAPVLAAVSITLIGCTITSAAVHGLVVA